MTNSGAGAALHKAFPSLGSDAIEGLLSVGRMVEYPDKTILCHEGEQEGVFYIILDGKVDIYKHFGGETHYLATKHSGEFFGEMALLLDEPRTANVVTSDAVQVMEIDREAFNEYMLAHPHIMLALMQQTVRQLKSHQDRLNAMLLEQHQSMKRQPRIFVSYSQSNSDFTKALINDLLSEGLNIWLDQLHISPGEDWDAAIDHALNTCDHMLLIVSKDSMASDNVQSEWRYFLVKRKLPVIPVLYEKTDIPHRRLDSLQYIDFVNQEYRIAVTKLINALAGAAEYRR